MNIFLIFLVIIFIIIIYLYLKNHCNKGPLNIDIKVINPKKLKKQEKKIILEPVDIVYYEKLKKAKEQLKEARKQNYRMNKETINNEVAELPNNRNTEHIELRLIDNLNNIENLGNNNQNVHDTTVQDTIKKKYFELKNTIQKNNYNIIDIINYAKNNKKINSKEEEDKLKLILDEIFNRNAAIMNLEYVTEVEILMLVWSREGLREQIINELLDCYEPVFKHIVCPTGVVTRLLNADIVINPERSPRTIELLREEMLNIAANVRTKLENNNKYNKLEEKEQNIKLKEEIKMELNKTYVNIISSEIIQKELDTWLDYI
jgi:hypothetical protein